MAERQKIATVTPAKYRAGSVGSGDPTPQEIGLPLATPKAPPLAGFPKDGGTVSPAEMSGFFLPGNFLRQREKAEGRRSDLIRFINGQPYEYSKCGSREDEGDCFVLRLRRRPRNDVFDSLPGAAGHHRWDHPRNAAVTLTPSPRPQVGDFFCLLINLITCCAAGTMIPAALIFMIKAANKITDLMFRESQFPKHIKGLLASYLDWKVEAIIWFFMFYIFLIAAALQPRTSMPYLGGAPKLDLGAMEVQSQTPPLAGGCRTLIWDCNR